MAVNTPISHELLTTPENIERTLRQLIADSTLDPKKIVFTTQDCSTPERLERILQQFMFAIQPSFMSFNVTELKDPYMLERVLRRLEMVLH